MADAIWQSQQTGNSAEVLTLARRATRSIPESGALWAIYMRVVEKATRSTEDMEEFEWEESIQGWFGRIQWIPY